MIIGVISDTHGLLRPEAVEALKGSEMILHAGDVGKPEILEALRAIAPVMAVRGNVDRGPWAQKLPLIEIIEVQEVSIYMIHDRQALDLDPAVAGFRVVISGHSHHPSMEEHGGVLYLNPGSAGPRRFRLPVCLARLVVEEGRLEARLIDLEAVVSDSR
jgi:hypothetical protein